MLLFYSRRQFHLPKLKMCVRSKSSGNNPGSIHFTQSVRQATTELGAINVTGVNGIHYV
jgi:hypothetical protein